MLERITIEVSPAELEALLIEKVKEKYGRDAVVIDFKVEARSMGTGAGEYVSHYFTGAVIKLLPLDSK